LTAAEILSEKLDALADALRAAGAEPDRTQAILETAATAAMHALVLDSIAVGSPPPTALPAVEPIRMAA
jgi:hypothetical protein